MTKNVTILSVDIDKETQTAKITMTPDSEVYIQSLFPTATLQEAIEQYFDLATSHLDSTSHLKIPE